jgi:hypothetical protein
MTATVTKSKSKTSKQSPKSARASNSGFVPRGPEYQPEVTPSLIQRLKRQGPSVLGAVGLRLGTLFLDYLLITATAFAVIPMLGAYMHQQSGLNQNQVTADGTVAMWLIPFAFVVVMLTLAEVMLMRFLWRAGTRKIQRMKERAETQPTSIK